MTNVASTKMQVHMFITELQFAILTESPFGILK